MTMTISTLIHSFRRKSISIMASYLSFLLSPSFSLTLVAESTMEQVTIIIHSAHRDKIADFSFEA